MDAAMRVLSWTFAIGFTCFIAGFVGPMIFAPGSNQGPLLGILITGPLGVVFGFVVGVLREILGNKEGPGAFLARIGVLKRWPPSLRTRRIVAGVIGAWLGTNGLGAAIVLGGVGPGSGIVLILSIFALYYAATGRTPRVFDR